MGKNAIHQKWLHLCKQICSIIISLNHWILDLSHVHLFSLESQRDPLLIERLKFLFSPNHQYLGVKHLEKFRFVLPFDQPDQVHTNDLVQTAIHRYR